MPDRRPVAFLGPCLSGPLALEVRSACAGFRVEPPARRGDVLRVLADQPEAILLVDGYYYTTPSVSHKEILYALAAGVHVAGASSMGALRAAELAPWGMEPIGDVAGWFLSGELEGDDEVALLHTVEEAGYRGLTIALVEVRFALSSIGLSSTQSPGGEFLDEIKALPFDAREAWLVRDAAVRHLGTELAERFVAALDRDSVKQRDAIAALQKLRGESAPRSSRSEAVAPTGYLNSYKEAYLAAPGGGASLGAAWNVVRALHPDVATFVRDQRIRFLLASACDRMAESDPPPHEVDLATTSLREHLADTAGPLWVETELREEALLELKAAKAVGAWGHQVGALQFLAAELHLQGPEDLLAILERQDEHLPSWYLVRSFAMTAACAPATALASMVGRVARSFESWAAGRRIARADLRRLAAELWGCAEVEVEAVGARRGLPLDGGNSPGLWQVLATIAPADRMPHPPPGYREAKLALTQARLDTWTLGPTPRRFSLPPALAALDAQLRGLWRRLSSDDPDVAVEETCQPSSRGPFLETIVETKIHGGVHHRIRGGFAWNPKRRALVTWSKEGDRLRHFGYQTPSADEGLRFECRFFPSGDPGVLVLRPMDRTRLEVRRLDRDERVTFVRVDGGRQRA